MRDEIKADGWFEEMHELGNKLKAFFMNQIFYPCEIRFKTDFAITRFQDDAVVVSRLNAAEGAQVQSEVDG